MLPVSEQNISTRALWLAELRATLALGWPLVLTNLAQIALTTTDVIVLGRVSAEALAASALGVNLYFAILIFAIGVVTATSPMMAEAIGRKLHAVRDVRRTFRQGLWSAAMISIPAWIVLWHTESILLLFGQEARAAADAQSFMHMLQWGFLPAIGFIVLRSFVAAVQRPMWALSNTFLFIIFVAVVIWHPKFRRYALFGNFWRADWPRLGKLWLIGLPIGAALAFEITVFNAAVFLMGHFGTAAIAAHAIAIQIASISFMVPMGLSQAATVRVGLAKGAVDPDGITRAGWTAFVLAVGFMASMSLLLLAMPRVLIGAFIDLGNPANAVVIDTAMSFLFCAAVFQIADGAQSVGAGMLRGLQDTRIPMIIAGLGYWGFGMGLSLLFAFKLGFGGVGIWIGLAAGLAVVAPVMLWRWTQRERLGLVPKN